MNARKYPRTMDQAFGPYNRSSQCDIQPMSDTHEGGEGVVFYVVCILGIFAAVVFNNYKDWL